MNKEEIFAQALSLPVDDRTVLAHALLDSLHEIDPEIEKAWVAGAERRIAQIESGEVRLTPAEEVFAKIEARLGKPLVPNPAQNSEEVRMRTYTAVIEKCPDTGLFVGYVPGFPGAHSQGETLEELNSNLREVIEMLLEDGEPKLEAEFVGTQTVVVNLSRRNCATICISSFVSPCASGVSRKGWDFVYFSFAKPGTATWSI